MEDFDGYPLGHGFINTSSKLTVRMLSRKKDTVVNEDFIEQRVRTAWEYRKATTDISSCRVIFGEADFLPGIVIDKFEDVLVVESLALGIDRLKPVILDKLKKVLAEDGILIRGIYERSDAKVRLQEGMERFKGFIGEPFDTKVEICENGVHYIVDVEDGQKTGFSWIRNITVLLSRSSARGRRFWTALHIPALLPECGNCRGTECSRCGCIGNCSSAGKTKRQSERPGRNSEIPL